MRSGQRHTRTQSDTLREGETERKGDGAWAGCEGPENDGPMCKCINLWEISIEMLSILHLLSLWETYFERD
jgi:hypothetical protein